MVAAGVPRGQGWAIQRLGGRLWVTTSRGGRVVSSGGPVDEESTEITVDVAGSDGVAEAGLIWRPPASAQRVVLEADWPAELAASAQADGWWLGVLNGVEKIERLPVAVRALDSDGQTVAVAEALVENIRIPLRWRMRLWLRRPARGLATYQPGR